MLKAVRLDDEKHKDIISYIQSFKDSKGKLNESAAIRELIVNGYKTINPNFKPQEKEIDVNSLKMELLRELENHSPDINQIKSQLREELLNEMNSQRDQNIMAILTKLNNMEHNGYQQPVYVPQPIYQQPVYQQPIYQQQIQQPIQQTPQVNNTQHTIKEETKQILNSVEEKIPAKKVEIPVDTNPLLANILANANR